MSYPSYLELEQEINRVAGAMMARNVTIGKDLIEHLKTQFSLEDVAGIMLISLERLTWFDTRLFVWTVENFIPVEIMQEITKLTSPSIYKKLIQRGLILGQDFSADCQGKMLLNERAKAVLWS